jgi:hypothetical protein
VEKSNKADLNGVSFLEKKVTPHNPFLSGGGNKNDGGY